MMLFSETETAKQNQKFPFHFLSAPPTPPAEEKKKGKEHFWFLLPRPQGADEARDWSVRFNPEPPRAPRVRLVGIRILLKMRSDFVVQREPKILLAKQEVFLNSKSGDRRVHSASELLHSPSDPGSGGDARHVT